MYIISNDYDETIIHISFNRYEKADAIIINDSNRNENQIVEIEYDLTQYFKNYYHNENDYIIKIVFSNFNLAEQLNLNFSK